MDAGKFKKHKFFRGKLRDKGIDVGFNHKKKTWLQSIRVYLTHNIDTAQPELISYQ